MWKGGKGIILVGLSDSGKGTFRFGNARDFQIQKRAVLRIIFERLSDLETWIF